MKRFLLACVLAAAFLGLLAAPAFATEPYQGWPLIWTPNTAYVHPWGDPAYWEEMDDQGNWAGWDTDKTSDVRPLKYKAIPSSYDVCFVVWTHGAGPQGQYEALPGEWALDGYLKAADGTTVWSTTVQETMTGWSPAFQMPGWTYLSTNKGEQTEWAIAWTHHQGPLDPGVYAGRGNYLLKHQMTAQYLADDSQRGPIHMWWKGATSTFPDFTLTVK